MVMTDEEINKACHSIVTGGKGCYHEWVLKYNHSESRLRRYSCAYEGCKLHWIENGVFKYDHPNFDPLNSKEDWASLLFFCVNKWEGWEEFLEVKGDLQEYQDSSGSYRIEGKISKELLSNQRALPEALAIYLKEGGVMAEIIKCDGCELTSPDQEGRFIANHWIKVQWSRNHLDHKYPALNDRYWNKLIFCQDCFDKLEEVC